MLIDTMVRLDEMYRQAEIRHKAELEEIKRVAANALTDGKDEITEEVITLCHWSDIVPQSVLGGLLGFRGKALANLRRAKVFTFKCSKCGSDFNFTVNSRDKYPTKTELSTVLCPQCAKKKGDAEAAKEAKRLSKKKETSQWLRDIPYEKYLTTTHWKNTRKKAFAKYGRNCMVCGCIGGSLDVHHKTYERRGYEKMEDLMIVCSSCHEALHERKFVAIR